MNRTHFRSLFSYLVVCLFLFGFSQAYPKWKKAGTEATLSWDVMGYYLYLPAAFIYHDLSTLEFRDSIMEKYRPSSAYYQSIAVGNGNQVMKYPIGLSLLYLPWFLLGHLIAHLGGYPADGFSMPYQLAIFMGSLLTAFAGLWFLRKLLLVHFRDGVVALVLPVLVLCTNYLNYTAIDGPMAHNYLFTICATILWTCHVYFRSPSRAKALGIGFLLGLAALVRPTLVVLVVIPMLYGTADIRGRIRFLLAHKGHLIGALLSAIVVGSLQLFYWKAVSGQWVVYSYEEQGFDWLHAHIHAVLFSYKKGWLVYTPVMLLSLAGLVFMWFRERSLFPMVLVLLVLHFYIVSSWEVWWYGGAFGQRAMIDIYPVLAIPMAVIFREAWSVRAVMVPLGAFLLFCAWLNIFQTLQAHGGALTTEEMNEAYYWKIFGQMQVEEQARFLLDTNEHPPSGRKEARPVWSEDFERFPELRKGERTGLALSGNKVFYSGPDTAHSPIKVPIDWEIPENGWLRTIVAVYAPFREWDIWRMPQLRLSFRAGPDTLKEKSIRLHRELKPGEWNRVRFDIRFPDRRADTLDIRIYNPFLVETFLDDLELEVYHPE